MTNKKKSPAPAATGRGFKSKRESRRHYAENAQQTIEQQLCDHLANILKGYGSLGLYLPQGFAPIADDKLHVIEMVPHSAQTRLWYALFNGEYPGGGIGVCDEPGHILWPLHAVPAEQMHKCAESIQRKVYRAARKWEIETGGKIRAINGWRG